MQKTLGISGRPLALFLFISSTQAVAQDEEIDALVFSLKDANEDTNKALLLNDLCCEYIFIDPKKKCIEYGGQGIILAKRLNYELGLQGKSQYFVSAQTK
jgi:hypothetical protein